MKWLIRSLEYQVEDYSDFVCSLNTVNFLNQPINQSFPLRSKRYFVITICNTYIKYIRILLALYVKI